MMTLFSLDRDINGYNGFGLPFSNNAYQGVLAATSEQTLTVPESPYADYPNLIAVFSFQPGASVWVSLNQTATLPSGSLASCSSEQNPSARSVTGGDVIHFITNDTSDEIGVTFYARA